MVVVELLAGPLRRRARVAIEPGQVQPPRHRVLVVAADHRLGALGDELDARQRLRAVTDGVAQAEHGIGAGGAVGEDGAQGLEVAVDVGQDRVPHAGGAALRRWRADARAGSGRGHR